MNTQPTVLVVEDDGDLRHVVAESLESKGFAVAQAVDAADALSRLEGFAYDALVLDLVLPDADGMVVLDAALSRYPEIRCIIMTGTGGVMEAVAAIKRGAVDFLTKPFTLSDLAVRLHRGLVEGRSPRLALEPVATSHGHFEHVIGRSPEMQAVLHTLELVSPMNSTVLLHGETGTGKELIARTIHENSLRSAQPFIAFSAAAIPEGLVEAELFGHVKGAFTGAVNARAGRFETAHRGTLFIDEVASMSMAVQAKLLRALQEREVERVGESRPFKFDVRIIAATNVDLRALVKEGGFREDLFYRLNVVPITLPPLRDRPDDIVPLAQHFVEKSCRHNGVPLRTITQEAHRALMDCAWPGNIRQLENAIEHAVAMSGTSQEIGAAMLPFDIRNHDDKSMVMRTVTIPDAGISLTSVVSQLERDLILQSLEKTGGNKRQAALLLNMSRTTLIDKIHRINASRDRAVA
jgi:DNA-binding NtrC family response regulator